MTKRELYEAALIEMNKVEVPSLLLEDYNYFINKAVQQYINKVYNRYDINQQSSDDLRVLTSTAEVKLEKVDERRLKDNDEDRSKRRIGRKDKFVYRGTLPSDYVHILNCIVDFKVKKKYKCYQEGDYVEFAAKRLTADLDSGILHNAYTKPNYNRPYFYIHNANTSIMKSNNVSYVSSTLDTTSDYNVEVYRQHDISSSSPELDSALLTNSFSKINGSRQANVSDVCIEIRFGDDDSIFEPEYLYIDYIKAPMFIELTYDDITESEDTTSVLEFPDYVCYEIVNEFVKLLMENSSDPRLQTNYAVNQTIGTSNVDMSKG